MRVAFIGGGGVEIWDADLPREQYPLFHELRDRAKWVGARLIEARVPVTDPAAPH